MRLAIVGLTAVAALTACSNGPCPRGQELREERFPLGNQVKARGCVARDAENNYRLQGKWEWFYENGQKEAEGVFKDGFAGAGKGETGIPMSGREGKWVFWHKSGQKSQESSFVAGKKEGLSTLWYENGQQEGEATFRNDLMEGLAKEWYPNGQKKTEAHLVGGKEEGGVTHWSETGQKISVANFRAGKLQGVATEWHDNGQKKVEGSYENDQLVAGTEKKWDVTGKPIP